jgi:hypothetical protein
VQLHLDPLHSEQEGEELGIGAHAAGVDEEREREGNGKMQAWPRGRKRVHGGDEIAMEGWGAKKLAQGGEAGGAAARGGGERGGVKLQRGT